MLTFIFILCEVSYIYMIRNTRVSKCFEAMIEEPQNFSQSHLASEFVASYPPHTACLLVCQDLTCGVGRKGENTGGIRLVLIISFCQIYSSIVPFYLFSFRISVAPLFSECRLFHVGVHHPTWRMAWG